MCQGWELEESPVRPKKKRMMVDYITTMTPERINKELKERGLDADAIISIETACSNHRVWFKYAVWE
jgi:hypothetical protein